MHRWLAITGLLACCFSTLVCCLCLRLETVINDINAITGEIHLRQQASKLDPIPIEVRHRLSMTASRFHLGELIQKIAKDNHIENLSFKISPEIAATAEGFALTEIHTSFTTIDDRYIFAFVSQLQKKLPGFVKATSMQIRRVNKIPRDLLQQIKQGRKPVVLKGEFTYELYMRNKTQ